MAETIVTIQTWFGPASAPAGEELVQWSPAAKRRGQRRYYRGLLRYASRVKIDESKWYDQAHWHVDREGWGNLTWRSRRAHLDALFHMYRRMLEATSSWQKAHQFWVLIDAHDSSQDAVYLHTQNPNGSPFPLSFEWVTWDAPVPERLRALVDDRRWQFGRSNGSWTHFCVRQRPHED